MKNAIKSAAGILLLLIVCFMFSQNKFIKLNEDVNYQWAQIETTLQRRNDLIPNLVNIVKEYVKHEDNVFREIAEARVSLIEGINCNDMNAINESSETLNLALGELFSITGRYPELKANEQFIALQDEIVGTENRINVARQYYNEAVRKYNSTVKSFPNSITATIGGYKPLPYFEADEGAEDAPIISFD